MGVRSSHLSFTLAVAASCSLIINCSGNRTESNAAPPIETTNVTTNASASPTAPTVERKLSSADAIEAFKKAGLEVTEAHAVEKPTDPNSLEIEGTQFSTSSAGKGQDGRVFSYRSAMDAQKMENLYDRLADQMGGQKDMSLYWSFARGNLLVQISRTVPKKKAQLYADALQSVSKSNSYFTQ